MYYLVIYPIVTFDEDTYIREDQLVAHRKVLHATDTFILEVRGVNVVTST